jgi:hypothetical protein
MGRTIPSFRIALDLEERDWKPFRDALDRSDRKKFDEMFEIPRLYISACSYAVQPVRLYPILMSILLYCYEQLMECNSQVDQMMIKVEGLQKVIEEKKTHLPNQNYLISQVSKMKPNKDSSKCP